MITLYTAGTPNGKKVTILLEELGMPYRIVPCNIGRGDQFTDGFLKMLRALKASGWHNYSLFMRPDGLLIGHLESDDIAAAQAAMGRTDVNARWQAEMGEFFVDLDVAPDEGFVLLEEVFNLEDQLASHEGGTA